MLLRKKKGVYHFVILTLWIGLFLSYSISYIFAIGNNWTDYLVFCADFWQYITEGRKYSQEWIFLKEIIEVWKEPLLFIITSNLDRILWLKTEISLVLMSLLIQLLIILSIYIGSRRINGKNAITIIVTLFISNAYLTNASLVYLVSRQILANQILILLFVIPYIYKQWEQKWLLISGILIAALSMAHRMGILFLWLYFIFVIISNLVKANFQKTKKNVLIILLWLLLSVPYSILQIGDILLSIQWYLWNNSAQSFISELEVFQNNNVLNTGWSFLVNANTSEIPIIHYIKYGWLYILLLIWWMNWLKQCLKIEEHKAVLTMFFIIIIYTSSYLIFWIRVLATLEIFLILVLSIIYQKSKILQNLSKIYPLIIIYFIIILCQWITIKSRTVNVGGDPSIKFITQRIKKENSFLIGNYCVSDLASQLGYENPNTLSYAPLANRKIKNNITSNINLHYYAVLEMSKTLMNSVWQKPYVHEILKDKDLYILFWYWTPNATMQQFYSKTHIYLNSPYVELIYQHNKYEGYVKYIFKVKKEHIQYFDTMNYLNKNLK